MIKEHKVILGKIKDKAAGEDKILTKKETIDLIRKLGFDENINEQDNIKIETINGYPFRKIAVVIYDAAGDFDKCKKIDMKSIEEYLKELWLAEEFD